MTAAEFETHAAREGKRGQGFPPLRASGGGGGGGGGVRSVETHRDEATAAK